MCRIGHWNYLVDQLVVLFIYYLQAGGWWLTSNVFFTVREVYYYVRFRRYTYLMSSYISLYLVFLVAAAAYNRSKFVKTVKVWSPQTLQLVYDNSRLDAILIESSNNRYKLVGYERRFTPRSFWSDPSLHYYIYLRNNSNFIYLLGRVIIITLGPSFYYLWGAISIFFIDACLIDDEPLWEPIEWSLVQSWIMFIFLFGWIAENLIISRYGSYVGRDKRVWMGWFKVFWLIEIYYIINLAVIALFIIVPFYFEINYTVAFIYSWWNWFSRVFFFKFTFLFAITLGIAYSVQKYVRWFYWKKILLLLTLVNIFLSYLLYTHFIMSFFGYLTNPLWYQNNRAIDYIQLSHEPAKWSWGNAKRDNYAYHNTKTVIWFKNDGPLASALLLFHLYLFLSLFFIYIYWITLFRRVYSTKEVPLTYTTYCISTLKQLLYCFLALYFFVGLSFIFQYWRLPTEFIPSLNSQSWLQNLVGILIDYPEFIVSIFNSTGGEFTL